MTTASVFQGISVFKGNSEVAQLMRAYAWETSPLGRPETWSPALLSIVNLMLNSQQAMCLVWGPALILLYNDPYVEIMGSKHPAGFAQPVDQVWSELWSDIQPILERSLRGEASLNENVPLLMHRHGFDEQTWFTFSYSPVYAEDGSIPGMFCVTTDTTRQVLAERHQGEEIARLRDLFEQAPSIMAVMREPNHVFEFANKAYLELVGNRDIIGKPLDEALPEIREQGFIALLDQVYQTGVPYVGRNIRVFLKRMPEVELQEYFVDFIYQPIRDYTGKINGIFVEGYDVTESVRANEALRESEQQLRQLANHIPHMAWMTDKDGWIHWYNNRWYAYTGKSYEEMQGWGWQGVHHPDYLEEVIARWQRSLKTGERFEMTFPLLSGDGEYRHFYTMASPLRDATGQIVKWLGTNTDVTEVIKAQEELKEANHRKDEFLAMLGHELRNPLAPISTSAELLSLAPDKPETVRKTSAIIKRQVKHMAELLNDLLDVSRVTRGLITLNKQSVNLHAIIDASIEQVRPLLLERQHHFHFEWNGHSPFVEGDPVRLIQIITNVLHNAIKYTPNHGQIELAMRQTASHFHIQIRDNGLGIAPELLPKVFDLFTQGKRTADRLQGGLGIGLSLVKSLVEMHAGEVAIANRSTGAGTRVDIKLPLAVPTLTLESSVNPQVAPALRLMIVDDNVDAAEALAMVLNTHGHQAVSFNDAHTAIANAAGIKPHICILDIGLPVMDGYEVVRTMKKIPELAATVFVAVTGYGLPQDKALAHEAGFHYHLVKPIQYEELSAILSAPERVS